MSRLFDRIVAGDFQTPFRMSPHIRALPLGLEAERAFQAQRKQTLQQGVIQNATAVVLDNVTRYFYEENPVEEWDFRRDFPNLAPPFPNFFMETRPPRHVMLRNGDCVPWEKIGWEGEMPKSWGVLVHTQDLFAGEYEPVFEFTSLDPHEGEAIKREGARWVLDLYLFIQGRQEVIGPLSWMAIPVDPTGQTCPTAPWPSYYFAKKVRDQATHAEVMTAQMHYFYPIFFGLSLLNCKNVSVPQVTPPAALSKKYRKKTGRDLVQYRVLEIDPMRRVLKQEGRSEQDGLKRALHICRGHFATYGKDGRGKLFGKVEGTFWRPQHVRGSKSEGLVVKDYSIKPPDVAP